MKRAFRMAAAAVWMALLLLVSTGCSFRLVASPEDLYTLPNLPAEYTTLGEKIQALLSSGMEYAAPVSGSHTQNVQLMDLNGDGEQEAVVFLRNSAEEQPLRIHIFVSGTDGYEEAAVISGSGSSIYSFNACDLDDDGRMELLVGWETGMEMRALTAYALQNGELRELARTGYARYAVADLDRDAVQELTVFRTDEQGAAVADLYVWKDGLEKAASCPLSFGMEELNAGSVVTGTLRDGTAALFVSGVSGNAMATDVLRADRGQLVNVVRSEFTGMTAEIFRYRGLLPEDINGDGVTEVPAAVMIPGTEYYRVDWYSYEEDGMRVAVLSTYHNTTDGWYLELPQEWIGAITVSRTRSGEDEIAVTFSRRDENAPPVLRICAISGSGREQKAARGNRLILSRQTDTIYTAELMAGNAGWAGTVTEDQLRGSFHLVERKWATGDN